MCGVRRRRELGVDVWGREDPFKKFLNFKLKAERVVGFGGVGTGQEWESRRAWRSSYNLFYFIFLSVHY